MELFITDLSLIKRALETAALFNHDIAQANGSEYFQEQSYKMIELKKKIDDMSINSMPFYKLEELIEPSFKVVDKTAVEGA